VQFINLTPHSIMMRDHDGSEFSAIPATSPAARMTEFTSDGNRIEGVGYIVSMVTALAYLYWWHSADSVREPDLPARRRDLYIPGREIRDGSGRIVACLGLRHVEP